MKNLRRGSNAKVVTKVSSIQKCKKKYEEFKNCFTLHNL